MIALYKMSDSLENQIGKLFQGVGYKTARFYSVNALLEQIMNPMVIITPAIYQKELEALQVPILPLSIRLDDIERMKEKKGLMNDSSKKCCVVASEEEIKWLKKNMMRIQESHYILSVKKSFFQLVYNRIGCM